MKPLTMYPSSSSSRIKWNTMPIVPADATTMVKSFINEPSSVLLIYNHIDWIKFLLIFKLNTGSPNNKLCLEIILRVVQ
jgi:hypothetical protein